MITAEQAAGLCEALTGLDASDVREERETKDTPGVGERDGVFYEGQIREREREREREKGSTS